MRNASTLAEASRTRRCPTARGVSKHLMSVYDEPMIYYWFSTRLLAAIREIPIIATNRDQPACRAVPCGGSDFGGKF